MNIPRWLAAHPAPPAQKRPQGAEMNYSRLKAYLDCPWLYKLRFVEGRPQPKTPPSVLGVVIHKTLEAFHHEDASQEQRLFEIYEEQWSRAGFPAGHDRGEWVAKGAAILKRFWKQELERRSRIVYSEREFLFELGPHQVRGMIDRVDQHPDGRYEIIDYKTHLDIETEEELAQNLQLAVYGLGAREGLGLEPSLLTLYYVAADRRVTIPYDPAGEEELLALLARVSELVAARDFRPDTSFCPSCLFRKTCSMSVSRD